MADYKSKTNWLPDDPITEDDLNRWEQGIADANAEGDAHRNNKNNPHEVTKIQLGLGNVSNDRQATKAEFEAHRDNKQNPHGVTKSQVGLGSVENYGIASRAEAEVGTSNSKYLTPLRMKEVLDQVATSESINVLPRDSKSASELSATYPIGISIMLIGEGSASQGFPSTWGICQTSKAASGTIAVQTFSRVTANSTWTRYASNGNPWSTWIQTESTDGAQEKVNSHANRSDNPHGVTKSQIGLGNVENIRQASKTDFDAFVGRRNNPHQVNTEQVNSFPLNWKSAGDPPGTYPKGITVFPANVENGGWPTRYGMIMTVYGDNAAAVQYCTQWSGSGDRIWIRNSQNNESVWRSWIELETTEGSQAKVTAHENRTNNPHKVTKAQVGLSNVDNVQQATKDEFNNHLNDKANPHNVTKAQVGLGSVVNYPVATKAQAEAGNHTASYMTPLRTREEIEALAQVHKLTADSGVGILLSAGTDLNTVFDTGFYRIQNAVNRPNDTGDSWGYVIVNKQGTTEALQIYIPFSNRIMYIRSSSNSGVWRDWVRYATQDELISHIQNTSNPHNVTKAQVGLGNVDNVKQVPATRNVRSGTGLTGGGSLASDLTLSIDRAFFADAEAGSNNEKVMTPATVKRAIETWADSNLVNNISGNKSLSDPIPSFPYGISLSRLPSGGPSNMGGILLTIRHTFSSTAGHQIFYPTNENLNDRHYIRYVSTTSNGWTNWSQYETTDGAQSKVNAHENKRNNPHNVTTEQVNKFSESYRSGTASPDSYPVGISLFSIGADNSWNPLQHGQVLTVKTGTYRVYQELIGTGNGIRSIQKFHRWGYEGKWTDFYPGAGEPFEYLRASLVNGWTHHSTWPVEYGLDGAGTVWLRGAMHGGVNGGNPPRHQFVLPQGYRPATTSYFVVNASPNGDTQGTARLQVQTNGTVLLQHLSHPGAAQWIAVDISFKAVTDGGLK